MFPHRSNPLSVFVAFAFAFATCVDSFTASRCGHGDSRVGRVRHGPSKSIVVPTSLDATASSKKGKKKKSVAAAKWIACTSTKEVVRAIGLYVRDGDAAAELGSQLREVSTTLCETVGSGGSATLVDVCRKFPNDDENKKKVGKQRQERRTIAMRRRGDEASFFADRATFAETESFEFWRDALFFRRDHQIRQNRRPQYDVLVVDMTSVAGNDLELTAVSLVREFLALNDLRSSDDESENDHDEEYCRRCRVVIVKSGSLHSLARRLVHAQRLLAGIETLQSDGGGHMANASTTTTASATKIVATVGVDEYRRTIPYAIRRGDVVLEVGSHFGTSTAMLHDAAVATTTMTIGGRAERERGDTVIDGVHVEVGGGDVGGAITITGDCEAKDLSTNTIMGGGFCIGVDVSPHIIAAAKRKYPRVPFEVGDAWKTAELARMKSKYWRGERRSSSNCADDDNFSFESSSFDGANHWYGDSDGISARTTRTYDTVYVDVGGLSGSEGLLEALSLLNSISNGLEPRCIVIKSLCVRRLASCLVPFSAVWRKERLKEQQQQQQSGDLEASND